MTRFYWFKVFNFRRIFQISVGTTKTMAETMEQPATVAHPPEDADVDQVEGEPPTKKPKIEKGKTNSSFKLEDRLNGILCCAVCLDLPSKAVFQCANGHLMCASCLSHLVADAKLKDEAATCPNCRCEITRQCIRNLAVEKAISELPTACRHCTEQLSRCNIDYHEREECVEREISCKYKKIGCPWRGPFHEKESHESSCLHPKKSAGEVMDFLAVAENKQAEEMSVVKDIFSLLSYEKVTFSDVQLKPYRTEEYLPKLYYETTKFTALGAQWTVKAIINDNQKNPNLSVKRTITYHLALKTKQSAPISLFYMALSGPFDDLKIKPAIHRFDFSADSLETPYIDLQLVDSVECNKLLAAKTFTLRVLMFQVAK